VLVGGEIAHKPARLVAPDAPIELTGPGPRFVSRGGEKLDAALDRFEVEVIQRRAIDCGASTGGFSDALLQRGAREVVAIDVGHGQLHPSLAADHRLRSHERTSVRGIDPVAVGGPADIVVADLSFISLTLVAPDLVSLCRDDGDLIVLVKPQFEAGRAEVSRGRGVVADPRTWLRVLDQVHDALVSQGTAIMGAMASPLLGADGNVEFLMHARAPRRAARRPAPPTVSLADAVAEAEALRGAHG
jgi:23S rRNA (cytidine1920-2'-O)/16S rRNA (cytidine1409-2'-O)-methyltransferase